MLKEIYSEAIALELALVLWLVELRAFVLVLVLVELRAFVLAFVLVELRLSAHLPARLPVTMVA